MTISNLLFSSPSAKFGAYMHMLCERTRPGLCTLVFGELPKGQGVTSGELGGGGSPSVKLRRAMCGAASLHITLPGGD